MPVPTKKKTQAAPAAARTHTRETLQGSGQRKPALASRDPKDREKAAALKRKPAKSTQDWKEEEQNERDGGRSTRGLTGGSLDTPEQMVCRDNYSIANFASPAWIDPEGEGDRVYVSFWFPTQKAIIDYPDTRDELELKTKLFKKLKVAYIGVLSGEPLNIDEARKSLIAQGATIPR